MTYRQLLRKGLLPQREREWFADWHLNHKALEELRKQNKKWYKRMGFR